MNFYHRLYFFDPAGSSKRDLYIASDAIDFITWFKKDGCTADATMLHTSLMVDPVNGNIANKTPSNLARHVVSGNPENTNQIIFGGLFFKCTVQYLAEGGAFKKYTAWLNPDNIALYYSFLPSTVEIFFLSGNTLVLCNSQINFFKALKEHTQAYRERKRLNYGGKSQ
jgi:hypothetical protein